MRAAGGGASGGPWLRAGAWAWPREGGCVGMLWTVLVTTEPLTGAPAEVAAAAVVPLFCALEAGRSGRAVGGAVPVGVEGAESESPPWALLVLKVTENLVLYGKVWYLGSFLLGPNSPRSSPGGSCRRRDELSSESLAQGQHLQQKTAEGDTAN